MSQKDHTNYENDYITPNMLRHGFDVGIVAFIICPQDEDEVACRIAEYWFYFADVEDNGKTPSELIDKYGLSKLFEIVTDYLNNHHREHFPDEFDYYKAVLTECMPLPPVEEQARVA